TRGSDLRNGVVAFATFGAPMALAFIWLEPVVQQTIPVSPGPTQLAKNLYHYRHDLVVHSLSRYSLQAARIDRNGSIAIAGLVLVPLAFFARRRRWGALVLGATVAVLGVELWPLVFPHFSDAVSLSQSRRLSGFIPAAVAGRPPARYHDRSRSPPLRASRGGPRLLALVTEDGARQGRADAGADPLPAAGRAGAFGRPRRLVHELPGNRFRPGLRRGGPADPRCEHAAERARQAKTGRAPVPLQADSGSGSGVESAVDRPHPLRARAGDRAPRPAAGLRGQPVRRLPDRTTFDAVKVLLVTRHF